MYATSAESLLGGRRPGERTRRSKAIKCLQLLEWIGRPYPSWDPKDTQVHHYMSLYWKYYWHEQKAKRSR